MKKIKPCHNILYLSVLVILLVLSSSYCKFNNANSSKCTGDYVFSKSVNACGIDSDGNNIPDVDDLDDDGDGVDDIIDAFPHDPCATIDTNDDGEPNRLTCTSTSNPPLVEDLDDDGDGRLDNHSEEDVTISIGGEDRLCSLFRDCDGDGFEDNVDAFPHDPCASIDTNDDGEPNNLTCNSTSNLPLVEDLDDDGDGRPDNHSEEDVTISIGGEDRLCSLFRDCDGDGFEDNVDVFPHDSCATIDTNDDGEPNRLTCTSTSNPPLVEDLDDDGDGRPDNHLEEDITISIGGEDRLCSLFRDCDGDGFEDNVDAFPTDSNEQEDTDMDTIGNNADVDDDGDGLIEISSIEMLHNMRYNTLGTSYDDEEDDSIGNREDSTGCGGANDDDDNLIMVCKGYELIINLDFDTDNNGTFSADCNVIVEGDNDATSDIDETDTGYLRTDFSNCSIDSNDVLTTFFPADDGDTKNGINEGWWPIMNFNAIFEGNGHTISNLYIHREIEYAGLFGNLETDAFIRNIGLIDGLIRSSFPTSVYVGALVGSSKGESIHRSYTTSNVSSSSDGDVYCGGLIGHNKKSNIKNSYTTGDVSFSTSSDGDVYCGGLIGHNQMSNIKNSYTTGDVSFASSSTSRLSYANSYIAGFVGKNEDSTIEESYATGNISAVVAVTVGTPYYSYTAGFVGENQDSTIDKSYATSNVSAIYRALNIDSIDSYSYTAGLVGHNYTSTIKNSYATGNIRSISRADNFYIAGLVGFNNTSTIKNSYATGEDIRSRSTSSHPHEGALIAHDDGGRGIISSYKNSEVRVTRNGVNISNELGDSRTLSQLLCPMTAGEMCGDPDAASSYINWNSFNMEEECLARSGFWDTNTTSCTEADDVWDFGSSSEFPGLIIDTCVHRPTRTGIDTTFSVTPICE